jgi:hypothetical protein
MCCTDDCCTVGHFTRRYRGLWLMFFSYVVAHIVCFLDCHCTLPNYFSFDILSVTIFCSLGCGLVYFYVPTLLILLLLTYILLHNNANNEILVCDYAISLRVITLPFFPYPIIQSRCSDIITSIAFANYRIIRKAN